MPKRLKHELVRCAPYLFSKDIFEADHGGDDLKLATQVPLSRYIGLIEITAPDRPLFDVILDATETSANPSVLACVRRPGMASAASESLAVLAKKLGAVLIS
jgi:hypothetical protein